jgi:hypothetical protein
MSYISGSISFCGNSVNCSTQTGQINGIACFWDSSSNCGIALLGEFYSGSINLGTIYEATFSDSSTNNGVILEQVDFFESAINNNCVCGTARFYDNSSNSSSGQLAEAAVFCDGAVNCGTIIGEACFYGTSSNSGVVTVAYFNESASNLGTISGSGLFFGTSVNSGIISGDAVFADSTTNNGTVEGSGSFATGASNEGGTVNGGSGVYTPPVSGLIINAYFCSANPGNYDATYSLCSWFSDAQLTCNLQSLPSSGNACFCSYYARAIGCEQYGPQYTPPTPDTIFTNNTYQIIGYSNQSTDVTEPNISGSGSLYYYSINIL